jgi:hypothetical protein
MHPRQKPPTQCHSMRVNGTFQNGIFQNRLFGQTRIFQNAIFQKESFRTYFQQNRNVSEWNHSERIFQKIFLAQPESFRMESFRMESFRMNLSENIFSKTGIFQKESFRKSYFSHGPLKLRTVHFGDITIIYESKVSEQNIFPWLKGTIESSPHTKFQINCSFK